MLLDSCFRYFKQLFFLSCIIHGPEGHPNNLPQPAWRLTELFFWSDLSWSRADLCANSYVISTHFSLLSMLPLCTRYISYIGILRIIHKILFRMIRLHDNELGPTDFQLTCYCSFFFDFWITCTYCLILFFDISSHGVFFNEKSLCHQIVFPPEFFPLFAWVYDNICYGLQHIHLYFFSCNDLFNFFLYFLQLFLVVLLRWCVFALLCQVVDPVFPLFNLEAVYSLLALCMHLFFGWAM